MSYSTARTQLSAYRTKKLAAMLGESASTWFSELWADVKTMLDTFSSSEENQDITAAYAQAPHAEKAAGHIRLDYVCGLRREVRKQYVSGEDGIYTDVTPFRHGVISAHGAQVFDDTLDAVIKKSDTEGGQA